MDPYQRTTRVVPFTAVPEALRTALTRVADVPDDQPILLTTATRLKKPGFFAKLLGGGVPEQLLTAVAHLPEAVALATHDAGGDGQAWRLPFGSLAVQAPPKVAGVDLPPGITLVSPMLGVREGSTGTYGLFVGPEPEAAAFLARLQAATR